MLKAKWLKSKCQRRNRSLACAIAITCACAIAITCARAIARARMRAVLVAGTAQRPFLSPLVEASGLSDVLEPLYVDNDFFGGNVDVTGLLVGCDIVSAVRARAASAAPGERLLFAYPRVVVNDQGLLLDGMTAGEMEKAAGAPLRMVSCNASEYLAELAGLAR